VKPSGRAVQNADDAAAAAPPKFEIRGGAPSGGAPNGYAPAAGLSWLHDLLRVPRDWERRRLDEWAPPAARRRVPLFEPAAFFAAEAACAAAAEARARLLAHNRAVEKRARDRAARHRHPKVARARPDGRASAPERAASVSPEAAASQRAEETERLRRADPASNFDERRAATALAARADSLRRRADELVEARDRARVGDAWIRVGFSEATEEMAARDAAEADNEAEEARDAAAAAAVARAAAEGDA
jgi:hypothetical protein